MARISEYNITPILEAAETWKETCLIGEGSIFGEEPIWSRALLEEFNEYFIQKPDFGEDDFYTKWEKQVKSGSDQLAKLAAEVLWLHYLFPSNVNHKTKVDQICEVYSWSGDQLNPKHPMLEALQSGVGSAGMGYNMKRPNEIEYLFKIVVAFKNLSSDEKEELLNDPWDFSNWLDATSDSLKQPNRLFRHILVFLLFPDVTERIASKNHKVKILKAWKGAAEDADIHANDSKLVALDKQLLAIRRHLESTASGEPMDFYHEKWLPKWDPESAEKHYPSTAEEEAPLYGQIHPLMQRFQSIMPDFIDFENPGAKLKEHELDYKHDLLESFKAEQSLIESKLDQGDVIGVVGDLKRLINKTNLVNWRGWDLMFGKPINEKASLQVLQLIRELSQGAYSEGKLEPLFDALEENGLKPGWTLPTALLWLWNPNEYYPVKSRYIREFALQLGRKLKMAAPSSEHLHEFMQLGYDTRDLLAPWKPKDWIDVQSFMWVVSAWEKPDDTMGPLAEPFDQIFNSTDEANLVLDTIEIGLRALGLEENLAEDPRVSITLPSYAGRTGTLRINFASWPPLGVIRKSNGECFLQFMSEPSLLPEGSFIVEEVSSTDVNLVFCHMPIELLEDVDLESVLSPSMEIFAQHFESWKGTPYRRHHQAKLCDLFFKPEARRKLLTEGFSPTIIEPTQGYDKTVALKELFIDEATFDRMATLLRRKKNLILQGPPGVGKSYLAKRLAYALMGAKDSERVTMIQFHQSYAYEDFIQGYRPSGGDGASFEKRDGVFFAFCQTARINPEQDYYFIIDEINRGNLSRIFGELMLLIEPDKRGSDYALPLTYSPERTFFVPENVHIIGMMNTADRSLAMVDYALRRRFAFMDLKPAFSSDKFVAHLKDHNVPIAKAKQIQSAMTALNKQIEGSTRDLGEGYCIGHSFFCPTQPVQDVDQWYREIVETEIQPLLEEYWADSDRSKVEVEIEKLLNGE